MVGAFTRCNLPWCHFKAEVVLAPPYPLDTIEEWREFGKDFLIQMNKQKPTCPLCGIDVQLEFFMVEKTDDDAKSADHGGDLDFFEPLDG